MAREVDPLSFEPLKLLSFQADRRSSSVSNRSSAEFRCRCQARLGIVLFSLWVGLGGRRLRL